MALLTIERLFWHCGAHTAKQKIGPMGPIPPIPYTKVCCFLLHVGTWMQQKFVIGQSPEWGRLHGDGTT